MLKTKQINTSVTVPRWPDLAGYASAFPLIYNEAARYNDRKCSLNFQQPSLLFLFAATWRGAS